jgi:hypothetical protein
VTNEIVRMGPLNCFLARLYNIIYIYRYFKFLKKNLGEFFSLWDVMIILISTYFTHS